MKIASALLGIVTFGLVVGCSNSNYHSSQWDLDAKSGAVAYSVDGWVWLTDQSGKAPPKKLVEGEFPAFIGRTGKICFTRNGVLWLYDCPSGVGKPLTQSEDHQEDVESAYCPKNGRIYFARFIEDGWLRPNRYDIYSCRLDGSDLIRHTNLAWYNCRLSTKPFSDDSVYFVASSPEVSQTPDAAVMKMSLKFPYAVTQVFSRQVDPWEISASPSDDSFAELSFIRGGMECRRITAKNGSSKRVGGLEYGAEWPLLAADGTNILYMMHKGGVVTLNKMSAQGQESVLFQIAPEPVANDPKQTRVGQ